MSSPKLATCQVAAWEESAVKFELKLSNENGRRKQTKKRGGGGVGDVIEMTCRV